MFSHVANGDLTCEDGQAGAVGKRYRAYLPGSDHNKIDARNKWAKLEFLKPHEH